MSAGKNRRDRARPASDPGATHSDGEARDPFARYLERLRAVGFHPSTVRGQNFLLDPTLHRWIAAEAGVGASDHVIEIGVGLGFLTRELAARAAKLLAVEIEPRLLDIAREDMLGQDNVEWLLADALGGPGNGLAERLVSFAATPPPAPGRLLVVANLPYSVSGPLLAEMVQLPRVPDSILVLVQKELGQRLAAACGNERYGGLSVLVQSCFEAKMLRDVAPGVFRPRPKVVSSVVQLTRRADLGERLPDPEARRHFARFVRGLFGQRRKVLRSTVVRAAEGLGWTAPRLADDLAKKRAEQLSVEQLLELFQSCAPAV
ncbi:MAG: 16S rRNA (adenine(1518)-N(6)/adenine(1519)-N(6))-dimethyltransferase RsmA [Planctomycetota bacterium]